MILEAFARNTVPSYISTVRVGPTLRQRSIKSRTVIMLLYDTIPRHAHLM